MTNYHAPIDGDRPKRARTKPLVRHILPSDSHDFVTRIFQLGIVSMHFESYEDLARHADCKYAFDVNQDMTAMSRRVESLNMAGDLLWPEVLPTRMQGVPISAYQWLIVASDVFLMRYVSVVDCALILANAIFECGLERRRCSVENLRQTGASPDVCNRLAHLLDQQGELRSERNARFHHGRERVFTDDNQTFQTAAILLHRMGGVGGNDRFGRKIDVERFLKQGLVELQREFNAATRVLVRELDRLYDDFSDEFEMRFAPRIRASTHGLRVSRKS